MNAMRLTHRWVLNGPNAWTERNAIRVILESGAVQEDAEGRLRQLMSGFALPGQTDEEPIDAGQVLAHLILDLQHLAGENVAFGWSAPGTEPGTFDVVCEYYRSGLALSAATLAVRVLNHVVLGAEPDFNFADAFDRRVIRHIRERQSDLQREPIVRAAERRGIPIRELNSTIRLLELGTGAYQERFVGLMSSRVREASSRMARNKMLSLTVLREHGIPVPDGGSVNTVSEALDVAERIGYPVVVKPMDRGHGRGVFVDVHGPEALREFAERALQTSHTKSAIVEEFVPGKDYRVFVLEDTIAAVAERIPAHVIGDGRRNISELISEVNAHPDRGTLRVPIEIDEATTYALDRQGMTPEDVPEAGRRVLVKFVSNGSQGGTTADRTEVIHPENARFAIMTARIMGMKVCGVDLRMPDIAESIWDSGGAILEVNAEPGYLTHIHVEEGEPRDIGEAVVEWLFPPGAPFRPLTVALTSSPDASETGKFLERILREAGKKTGIATRKGVAFDGALFGNPPTDGAIELGRVMHNDLTECAILEIGAAEIEHAGLPFRHVDVAVISPLATHITANGPRDVASVLADLVVPEGTLVIDALDPRFRADRAAEPLRWIVAGTSSDGEEIAEHLERGGRAVCHEQGAIVLRTSSSHEEIVNCDQIAITASPEQVLRATAAAIAVGVTSEAIRAGLIGTS